MLPSLAGLDLAKLCVADVGGKKDGKQKLGDDTTFLPKGKQQPPSPPRVPSGTITKRWRGYGIPQRGGGAWPPQKVTGKDNPARWRLSDFGGGPQEVARTMIADYFKVETLTEDDSNRMIPWTSPFYLIDGGNLFHADPGRTSTDMGLAAQDTHVRRCIDNQRGKRLPVLVVFSKETFGYSTSTRPAADGGPSPLELMTNKLSHMASGVAEDAANVHIIVVDVKPCEKPLDGRPLAEGETAPKHKDKNCMRRYPKNKDRYAPEGNESRCQYYSGYPHPHGLPAHRPVTNDGTGRNIYEEQYTPGPPVDHLLCEFDDVTLSAIYHTAVKRDVVNQVEIVSDDQVVLKSMDLCSLMYREIASMRVNNVDPGADADDKIVNFHTEYYAMRVATSSPAERLAYMQAGDSSTAFGVRPLAAGEVSWRDTGSES